MENKAMKKKDYKKPAMEVVELKHRTCLLQDSGTRNDPPEYDDWMN